MTFVNGTSDYHAVFQILRLDDGSSYQELAAIVAENQRRLQAGEPLLSPPSFAATVIQRPLEPMGRSDVDTTLARGSYAIVCSRVTPSRTEALIALGPYVVP